MTVPRFCFHSDDENSSYKQDPHGAWVWHHDYVALENRVAILERGLRRIASGSPDNVRSPLGSLHAAGMIMQWEADKKYAEMALFASMDAQT